MTRIACRAGTWGTYLTVLLLALGCGGRAADDGYVSGDGVTNTPPPTCDQICKHVVDSCFPGAEIEPCARDCEAMVAEFTSCKELDPFLRCNVKAKVVCTDRAVIDDCSLERNRLLNCKS